MKFVTLPRPCRRHRNLWDYTNRGEILRTCKYCFDHDLLTRVCPSPLNAETWLLATIFMPNGRFIRITNKMANA